MSFKDYSTRRKLFIGVGAVVGVMMVGMVGMMAYNAAKGTHGGAAFAEANPDLVPKFSEIETGAAHGYHGHIAQPVLDMISFDPLGDGTPVLALTGGEGQHDMMMTYRDGAFVDIAGELGLAGDEEDISYSFVAGDINGDGVDELLVGRQSGVYVYTRGADGKYSEEKIDIALPENATPVGLSLSDTNGNGAQDLFIATFIDHRIHSTANFNDPDKRVSNAFWRNNGDGSFTDASADSGLDLHANTFLGKFVDLDNDGDEDLTLGTNTAQGFVFESNGDGTFTEHLLPIGYGFWMGVGIDDFDGNGFPDIYLANSGDSVPSIALKGDLSGDQRLDTQFRLLANDGDFNFTDISESLNLDNSGFGWGMAIADFNGNGTNEVVVTENFIGMPLMLQKWLPSKGAIHVRGPDGTYQNTAVESGIVNKNFGYRAEAVDLDQDGQLDLVIANVDGPLRAFMNSTK